MDFIRHDIEGVVEIRPKFHRDDRGWFCEAFKASELVKNGVAASFVQDNRAFSREAGTVRGLHFQLAPHAQGKLVSVLRGAILDVAVDLRRASPSFGRHVAVRLDAESGAQLYVPEGFGHGYCTLEPDTEVFYKVTSPYAPQADRAVFWADEAIGIDWPVAPDAALLSEKDRRAPRLADAAELF